MQKIRGFRLGALLLTLLLVVAAATLFTSVVYAATDDSAIGTVTIGNATPTVATVELVDSGYSGTSTLTPDDSTVFGINATIGDANTLTDLHNVTFYIFDFSQHGGDYESASASEYLVKIVWTESDDQWTITQEGTEWTMQTPQDPGTGSGSTSYEFTCRFDASRATRADTDWNATVHAYDDQNAEGSDADAGLWTVANYFDIVWSSSTFTWGSVTAASQNNTMSANRTLTIRANADWDLTISASFFTAGGESDIDPESNDTIMWDGDGVTGGSSFWVRNTTVNTGTGTWDAQTPMTSESTLSRNVHIWFCDPGGQFTADVEYAVTVEVTIQADT